jgi:hypothetical protein
LGSAFGTFGSFVGVAVVMISFSHWYCAMDRRGRSGIVFIVSEILSRCLVRCIACLDSSCIVGIGVLFCVRRWCTLGMVAKTCGAVGLVEVDSCSGLVLFVACTLGTGVSGFTLGDALFTLRAGVFSLSFVTLAVSLKISVRCCCVVVCFGC